MAESKGPGDFQYKTITMTNYDRSKTIDLSQIIYEIFIDEKIDNVTMSGHISIVDSQSLIDNFPILGEEEIYMVIEDFFGNEQEFYWHVVNISPISFNSKSSTQEYTLMLRTKDYVATERLELKRSFRTPLSVTAQTIFDDYFETDKEIDIEETSGSQTLVIPAKTPYETMMFLARKSFSIENPSSTYKFFEHRNGYSFLTMERLIDKVNEGEIQESQIFTFLDPKTIESRPEDSMRNFINYYPLSRMNLINEIRDGAMISQLTLLDLSLKTVEESVYKHYEEKEKYSQTDSETRDYHTKKFTEDFFSEDNILQSYLIFNDNSKPAQFYEDIVPKRISSQYYMNNIVVQAEAYGSWDIELGNMINFIAPKAEVNDKKNDHDTLSGWYLVTNIKNKIMGEEWRTTYTLVKTALKGTLDE